MLFSLFLDELFAQYPFLLTAVWLAAIAAAAILVERIVSRWVKKFIARTDLPPHVGNSLLLAGRLVIFLGVLVAVLRIGGVSSDVLVALSALGGAAIGFASSQTIGNVIAGLYILASRPFRAGDYVRLDGVEGIVREISVNYTKILTIAGNVVWISNRRLLDRDIVSFRYKGGESNLFRYGLEIGFDYSVPAEKTGDILDKVAQSYVGKMPRKAEYELVKLTNFSRNYVFYIHVEDPRDVFRFQPSILRDITELWDEAKKGAR
jgi:small conductance mechanosensitive channel